MEDTKRLFPNILITGTPGVGKSTLCKYLEAETGFKWLDVSKIALENNCLVMYDQLYECPVLNENLLMNYLEPELYMGGKIVEYYACDIFPEDWFDVVYVVKTDCTTLNQRLVKRGYKGKKLTDNLECELHHVILEEAFDSYKPHIIHILHGTKPLDILANYYKVKTFLEDYSKKN